MSEVKPVETTEATSSVAPVVEATPVVEQPVVEAKLEEPVAGAKPEEPTTVEEPAGETEATAEAPVEVKEVEPIAEGALETKIPVIPLFLKKQTYFFSDDAISEEHLSEYLKKDKTKFGHANYAHATQTGKGLLFSGKEKTKITGILRIDGAEVTTQGDKKFTIKSAGHELQLEAGNATLRERWVHTLKIKISESEGVHAATTETEGYKAILEKLTKPIVVAPVVKKEEAPIAEDKKEEGEAKVEGEPEASGEAEVKKPEGEEETPVAESPSAKVEKKEEKGKRSSSRNRLNRFSFFGKKEEKKEEKKEDEPVAEVKEEGAPTVPEPITESVVAAEAAPAVPVEAEQPLEPVTETAVIQEPTSEALAEPKEEEPVKSEETSPVTSPKSNRKSFLGGLFGKKDKKTETPVEESKTEATPEVAPTIEEPTEVTEQPATAENATTEALPDASEPAAVEPEIKEEPVEKERERKSSLFGSLRRDKSTDGEDKPRRSLSFWKKEKKVTSPGKEEPAAIVESETDVPPTSSEPVKPDVKAETEETPAAPPVPDVLSTGESSEVRDGKIGDVVPAAITA